MDKGQKVTKEEGLYDSVFDFIFGIQKSKKNRSFPRNQEELGEFSSALIEMGTQPLLFPLETAFTSLNDYFDKATEVDLGSGVNGGIGSGAFSEPNAYSRKEISKNRARATWASVGGGVHYMADGALFSLYSKKNGVNSKIAIDAGSLYGALLKERMIRGEKGSNTSIFGKDFFPRRSEKTFVNENLFGYKSPEDIGKKEDDFFDKAVNLRMEVLVDKHPGLSKAVLLNSIRAGQNILSKEERFSKTVNYLYDAGMDKPEGEKIANDLWGSQGNDDLGLYRLDRKVAGEKIDKIVGEDILDNHSKEKIFSLLNEEDTSKRIKGISEILSIDTELKGDLAESLAEQISSIQFNDGFNIAKDSIFFSLSKGIRKNMAEKWDVNEDDIPMSLVEKKIKNVFDNAEGDTLGMKLERGVMVLNWLSLSKIWNSVLLEGKWEKFGMEGLGSTQLVKGIEVKKDGVKTGEKFYAPADSVIGKLVGSAYYLHPRNLLRGLFLDGSIWLKLACDKNGNVNTKSLAYLFYNMTLGRSLSAITKPFKNVVSKITNFINPFFEGIKRVTKNLLTKIVGATGLGGLLINFVMNFISDRLAYVMNQIVIIILLGIVGILFIMFESTGIMYSDDNDEFVYNASSSENVFSDNDLVLGEDE